MKRSEIYLKAIPIIEGGLNAEVMEGDTRTGGYIYTCWVLDALMFGKKKEGETLRGDILDFFPEFEQQRPANAPTLNIWFNSNMTNEEQRQWRINALRRAHEIAKSNGN